MVVSNGDGDAHGLHASRFNNHLSLGSNQEQALPSQISVRCRCIAGFKWRTDTVISDCVWGGLAAESRDYATSTPSVGCADRFPRTACTRTLWDCIARLAGPKFGRVAARSVSGLESRRESCASRICSNLEPSRAGVTSVILLYYNSKCFGGSSSPGA